MIVSLSVAKSDFQRIEKSRRLLNKELKPRKVGRSTFWILAATYGEAEAMRDLQTRQFDVANTKEKGTQ